MKRYFCDCCGNEIIPGSCDVFSTNNNKASLPVVDSNNFHGNRSIYVTIGIGINPQPNFVREGHHFDMCANCMWKAVYSLDKRPKPPMPVPKPLSVDFLEIDKQATKWFLETQSISSIEFVEFIRRILIENGIPLK